MDEIIDFNKLYNFSEKEIRHKFEYIGEGISRKVFGINEKYVLKLAKGREGLYQNRVEYHIFTTAEEFLKKYLCPIIWFSPKMLIMKRAEPLSKSTKDKHIELSTIRPEKSSLDDLNYLAFKNFLYYDDIISTSSWGSVDGMNVLIDYGCTSKIGDIYYEIMFSLKETGHT